MAGSTDTFLSLISNPFKSSIQTNAIWASLGTSLGFSLLLALLFSLFRPRNTLVYAPKTKHADERHAPPVVGRGIFAWIKPIIKTREPELVDKIGMDATIFLRFAKMCRNTFVIISIVGCCVMIPVNLTESTAPSGSSVLTRMTPLYLGSNALWSHVVCAYCFDIIVAVMLWRNYRAVRTLRRRYFNSPDYQRSLHARTLMITDIPSNLRSDEGILRLTDEVNPGSGLPRAAIGRNVKELPGLISEHNSKVRELESVLAKYLKKPDKLPAKRPTMRPKRKHRGDHPGDAVDSIDYLRERIEALEVEIKMVRETIDKRNAMPYGFASWDQIEEAHAVAYVGRKKHPQGTIIRLAPRPNDIIWENLPLNASTRKWKRIMNAVWVTLLTVAWIAPNALIAIFLSDLSNLGQVWPAFQTQLTDHPDFWSAVQGIAAPALTSLVYLLLPIIFRKLAMSAGDTTKTSRERHVVAKLYTFFVFNNLVVFSIFSAVWSFTAAVIAAEGDDESAWDAVQEGEFYIRIMTALCQISPFWVTWLLQRNLAATLDLSQLWTLVTVWFKKTFLSPTPRELVEWTAPPPFEYASYYNYFLFYATVALCFATLQPIVLPVTAFYFTIDSWLKKYLLMYVFVTKTESGGQFWRVLFNRIVFAAILANVIVALIVKASGTWTMVFALAPLPFLMLGFKLYCMKAFDDDCDFYSHTLTEESLIAGMKTPKLKKNAADRIASRFGHPALFKPLITPMVHERARDLLTQIYSGRTMEHDGYGMNEYSDIAMSDMYASNPNGPGATTGTRFAPGTKPATTTSQPFEVVPESHLDFTYYKNRPDFKDEGGDIYGRPDDLISERSQTPKSFLGGGRPFSPAGSESSRNDSPSPPPMPGTSMDREAQLRAVRERGFISPDNNYNNNNEADITGPTYAPHHTRNTSSLGSRTNYPRHTQDPSEHLNLVQNAADIQRIHTNTSDHNYSAPSSRAHSHTRSGSNAGIGGGYDGAGGGEIRAPMPLTPSFGRGRDRGYGLVGQEEDSDGDRDERDIGYEAYRERARR